MEKEKYALLDTDFISKMYLIRKDVDNPLLDRVMELPGYRFYCHSQIRTELGRHNVSGAREWLEEKISAGRIICCGDEAILDSLASVYGTSAPVVYAGFLKTACEAYRAGYFEEQFKEIWKLDYRDIVQTDFLETLNKDCDIIGISQNLGEIKTYVLLQLLSLMYGEQIYVFCSDDRNARSGIVSVGRVRCISVLSSFLRLKKECDFQMEDARDYILSWLRFCEERNQKTFKIQEKSKEKRMCKIPCEQVMREIYEDKFEELQTGDLRYR